MCTKYTRFVLRGKKWTELICHCLFCEHPKMTIHNLYSELLDRGGKDGWSIFCLSWPEYWHWPCFWILISASTPPCPMIWLDSVKCNVNLLKCAIWITFWFHWYMTANLSFPNHFFQIKCIYKALFFIFFFTSDHRSIQGGGKYFFCMYSNGATHTLLQSLASYTCSEDTIKIEQCLQSASSPSLLYYFLYI